MIIFEIGHNHLGSEERINFIVNQLIEIKADCITFQIREKSFYNTNNFTKSLKIKNNIYSKVIDRILKSKTKIGLAISDIESLKYFDNLFEEKIAFYKILSKDLDNSDYLKMFKSITNQNIALSTGLSSINSIKRAVNIIGKNTELIHTALSNDSKDANLSAIKSVRETFIRKLVSYGHHSRNMNLIFSALSYKPQNIYLYVKTNEDLKFPDDKHAIELRMIKDLVKEILDVSKGIGDGIKKETDNMIMGQL